MHNGDWIQTQFLLPRVPHSTSNVGSEHSASDGDEGHRGVLQYIRVAVGDGWADAPTHAPTCGWGPHLPRRLQASGVWNIINLKRDCRLLDVCWTS